MRTCYSLFFAATIFVSVSARPAAVGWDLSASSNDLAERGLIYDALGGYRASGSASAKVSCPSSFVCNGKGTDGYEFDIWGNAVPALYPTTWRYFGLAIGWAPVAGWSCGVSWEAPSAWLWGAARKCVWWAPTVGWIAPSGFNVPSFWTELGWHASASASGSVGVGLGASVSGSASAAWPSASWACNKSGKDGYHYDHTGATLPAGFPSGWLWFGVGFGWAPPQGWADVTFTLPSACVSYVGSWTWWSPPTAWKCPSSITSIPTWWPQHGSASGSVSGSVGGSGSIGGGVSGSAAATGSVSGSAGGSVGASGLASATGGVSGSVSASASGSWPSATWTCSGSGKDGYHYDHKGAAAPSWAPSGWLWFGSSYGWGPYAGWTFSGSFTLPQAFIAHVGQFTWWSPPSSWVCPSTITSIPTWWPQHASARVGASGSIGGSISGSIGADVSV